MHAAPPDYSWTGGSWRYALRCRPLALVVRKYARPSDDCADIGAADGSLGAYLLGRGLVRSVTGFEIQEAFRRLGSEVGIDIRSFDADRDDLPREFDLVICSHLVEHLRDPDAAIRRIQRKIRPGGTLVVVTPNAGGISAKLMGTRWIGLSDSTHISLRSHTEWLKALTTSGWTVAYTGSSFISDVPRLMWPVAVLSKVLFWLLGYVPWSLGNSSVFVLRSPLP